uniref:Uncharacterized protein n=1 Tax=Rhizophora mucronata TaxID=61149 RepID=A0A2P2MDN2_RHIMU
MDCLVKFLLAFSFSICLFIIILTGKICPLFFCIQCCFILKYGSDLVCS